jgi:predicted metal-dependent enzyme (double-stranded beta helix superfamily)
MPALRVRAAVLVVSVAAAVLWVDRPSGAQAVAIDRGSRDYALPGEMKWRDTENGKTANLYGDPAKPGLYAYVVKRNPNVWSKPHFHDTDRFITVLDGTFWVGTGKFDQQRTVPLKTGSFVRDVARGIHFDGTKEDGATLYFIGIGPVGPSHPGEPGTATASASSGDVVDPASRQIQPIEKMPKESFFLYGDSSKPGLYVQHLKRPPNNWSRPHYHPIDRVVMVIGGTMWIGTGSSADQSQTVGVPRGGFIRDIARGVHYDGSRDEPLWIQIAGVGPSGSINVDAPR